VRCYLDTAPHFRFPVSSEADARELQALIADVERHGWTGARIFVGPRDLRRTNYNDVNLYFLFPRFTPATYFLEMDPGSANRPGSRLARDLKSADLLLLTDRYDSWDEPNASRMLGPEQPLRVVRRRFRILARHGRYEILGRFRKRPRSRRRRHETPTTNRKRTRSLSVDGPDAGWDSGARTDSIRSLDPSSRSPACAARRSRAGSRACARETAPSRSSP